MAKRALRAALNRSGWCHRAVCAAGFSAASLAAALAPPALAQVDPLSGIDFVTIGAPGNAPWQGNGAANDPAVGRGSVAEPYRIGRYEVTTAQWVEFYNALFDRPQSEWSPHVFVPIFWGAAETTPTTPGGRRWTTTSTGGMRPVGGINWRTAAIYCNWLHNGKSLDRASFDSGAYDVSTFGYQGAVFTDQFVHSPGAQYFIPSWDQWLKAAHYDPAKQNPDGTVGGWWTYSNGSDISFVGAPPPSLGGNGTANFGWRNNGQQWQVPLGAYAGITSPWGLYDVGGATSEWTEDIIFTTDGGRYRVFDGSYWGGVPASGGADHIRSRGGEFPSDPFLEFGFRIAATVPTPGVPAVIATSLIAVTRRRR